MVIKFRFFALFPPVLKETETEIEMTASDTDRRDMNSMAVIDIKGACFKGTSIDRETISLKNEPYN